LGRFGQIWADLGRFGQILGRLVWNWEGLGRFGQIWAELGRFGQMWTELGRIGRIWADFHAVNDATRNLPTRNVLKDFFSEIEWNELTFSGERDFVITKVKNGK
jgi:hypothetical protein